jgi:hypothetical protein
MTSAAQIANQMAAHTSALANAENGASGASINLGLKLMELGVDGQAAASILSSAWSQVNSTATSATSAVGGLTSETSALASVARTADGGLDLLSSGMTGTAVVAQNSANAFGGLINNMNAMTSAAWGASSGVSSASAALRSAYAAATQSQPNIKRANGGMIGNVVNLASGGLLSGGSGYRDDLYIGTVNGVEYRAMGGEMVMNQQATRENYDDLQRMNRGSYNARGDSNISVNVMPQTVTITLDSGEILKKMTLVADAHIDSRERRGATGRVKR